MKEENYRSLENLFLALSDGTRLRMMMLMSGGEVSVGFLADSLQTSQPKVSRHLAYLRNSGLVSTRRDGKWIYYAIDPPSDPVVADVLSAVVGSRRSTGTAASDVDRTERSPAADAMPIYLL